MTDKRFVKTPEAAKISGLSESTLRKLRVYGDGPEFLKMKRAVLYDLDALEAWLRSHRCRSTAEYRGIAA